MKKMTLILILILASFTLQAPVEKQNEQVLYKDWQDRKFLVNVQQTEFNAGNLKKLIEILCKHPEIVYAQARLESAEFKSKLFLDYNNVFGMKKALVRPTTAIGEAMGHAQYKHWSESVYDYMLYQKYYEDYLQIDFNYIDYFYFLKMYRYAQDKQYIKKLKDYEHK